MVRRISIEDLDAVLDRADSLIHSDYGAAMAALNDVAVEITPPAAAADAFSAGYADWVMQTYRRIAAIDAYDVEAHEADRNVVPDLALPEYFPYSTRDLGFIGRYMAGVGMILAELGLPPGSRIVEYGVGWGHVAAALARAGHDVTVVDIEAKFLRLAQRQAEALGCRIGTHYGAFGDRPFPSGEPRADAVVFFEAFHHAFEHLDVLRRLRKDVLRPGGVLLLAAEPVHPAFPYPWGIRPDGHALWAVRRHKWMELGFQEDYLIRALIREGFLVSRIHVEALGPFGLLYRARLHDGHVSTRGLMLPATEAASWAAQPSEGEPHLWAQVDSRATLDHDPSWAGMTVVAANHMPVPLAVTMDAGGAGPAVRRVVAPGERFAQYLSLPASGRELRIWSETAVPALLGVGADRRPLGVAVEEWRYHAN
jgi:SAM-dependent methyltransferase